MYQIQSDVQDFQNKNYKIFKDNESNHYLADRVPNIGIINLGSILAAETKSFDLAGNNILSPIMVRSVYAFSGSTGQDEIVFFIYRKNESGVSTRIALQRFHNYEMPFTFPYGAILAPDMGIEIKPKYNVDALFIYVQPVNVIFSVSA